MRLNSMMSVKVWIIEMRRMKLTRLRLELKQ
jgi:hypothetical protein